MSQNSKYIGGFNYIHSLGHICHIGPVCQMSNFCMWKFHRYMFRSKANREKIANTKPV